MLLMLAMTVPVVIVGTAMDMTLAVLILTPLVMPLVRAADIDRMYLTVVFINNSIGLVMPRRRSPQRRGR